MNLELESAPILELELYLVLVLILPFIMMDLKVKEQVDLKLMQIVIVLAINMVLEFYLIIEFFQIKDLEDFVFQHQNFSLKLQAYLNLVNFPVLILFLHLILQDLVQLVSELLIQHKFFTLVPIQIKHL